MGLIEAYCVSLNLRSGFAGSERLNETEARAVVLNHMVAGRVLTSSIKNLEEIPSKGTRQPLTARILKDVCYTEIQPGNL